MFRPNETFLMSYIEYFHIGIFFVIYIIPSAFISYLFFQNVACWVWYHCQVCDIINPNVTNDECYECCNCACFPSMAKVQLQNGKTVTMSELQIGNQVQTGIYFANQQPYYSFYYLLYT